MKITAVGENNYQPIHERKSSFDSPVYAGSYAKIEKSLYDIPFKGLWGKKPLDEDKIEKKRLALLSTPGKVDLKLSSRISNVLPNLDDKSILLVGSDDAVGKAHIRAFLSTKYQKELHDNLEKVYYIESEKFSKHPLIIYKNDDECIIHEPCRSALYPPKNGMDKSSILSYSISNSAKVGDIYEFYQKSLPNIYISSPNCPYYDDYDDILLKENIYKSDYDLDEDYSDDYEEIDDVSDADKYDSGMKTENNYKITRKEVSKYFQSVPERTFDDVAGMDSTIEQMKKKLLYPILYPEAFVGDKNHGIIMYGEPGTGKTLLALATIGEVSRRGCDEIFFAKVDANELEESSWGKTEQNWRDIFEELENNQPSVIFIDEIDRTLGKRQDGNNYAPKNDVITQFLTLIDDIEKNDKKIWIIGATNRLDAIDPAVKRNGRLGNVIEVKKPDEKGCYDILNFYLKNKKVDEDFDRKDFSKELYKRGYTGADIANIVSNSRDKMYERCGVYEKMENGTFREYDLKDLMYTQNDFDEALKDLNTQKTLRKKIGY